MWVNLGGANIDTSKITIISAIFGVGTTSFSFFQLLFETSAVSSLIDIAIFLVFVYLVLMGFLFLSIFRSLKELTQSIDFRKNCEAQLGIFSLSSLAFGVLLYLFIRRISFLGSYLTFIMLSVILYASIIALVGFLVLKNKTLFRGIVKKDKAILGETVKILNRPTRLVALVILLCCFLSPLIVGTVTIYNSDPVVAISIIPKEIYYEKGGQIQDTANLDLIVKAVRGYAFNVNIDIEASSFFYVWFDKIENGTKQIQYLEFDRLISYPLQIQPSRLAENGTYSTQINWSYESAKGNLVKDNNSITTYIGKTKDVDLYTIPTVGALIIVIAIIVVFLLRKRR